MNRREFFKLAGLGTGGLFFTSSLLASALNEHWQAGAAVDLAIQLALENGASYADARIGPCTIQGHKGDFAPVSLLNCDLLGMRIGGPHDWRYLLIRDLSETGIRENMKLAFTNQIEDSTTVPYISAQFDSEKMLASKTSDPEILEVLKMVSIRFAMRPQLPIKQGRDLLFCDILLEQ
ncbi:MAG: hypothetical protein H6581_23415 [Bacteroidia bacterium]|nr:hypothetical protein [Bacteroidia bacterium]